MRYPTTTQVRRTLRYAEYLVTGLLVALGVALAASAVPVVGYRVYAVVSGSMAPAIPLGSMVIVAPASSYALGDVVTVATGDPRQPVTHRIVRVTDDGRIVTKGDANADEDPVVRQPEDVVGRVRLHIPLLGHVLAAVRTVPGFIFLVVIPGTLLMYHETLALTAAVETEIRRKMRRS